MTAGTVYVFPPFRLDTVAFIVSREGVTVPLAPKAIDLLVLLLDRPATLIAKDTILSTLWPGIAVTDNALTQVVSDLRQALGDDPAQPRFIQTVPRRGYRFVAPVEIAARPTPPAERANVAAPVLPQPSRAGVRETASADAYRSFTEGRLKLERMDPAVVPEAIADFERAIALDARYAPAHVGLAHARFWIFEASRAKNQPDRSTLAAAIGDAQRAIDLDPDLAEAHAALALMLTSASRTEEAVAAGRRAVTLEPGNWRNHCRLAIAGWGEERMLAFERVLALYPSFAYAYYGMAMVHVARGRLDDAAQTLRQGLPFQDKLAGGSDRFPAKGLHWLLGLTHLAAGKTALARSEFDAELATGGRGIYDLEFAANAYDGHGFAMLREGNADEAARMFERALLTYPDHVRSLLGLAAVHQHRGSEDQRAALLDKVETAVNVLESSGRPAEAAMAAALLQAARDRLLSAIAALDRLLVSAPPGFAGWTIPIEPLLASLSATPSFASIQARLAARAR